MEVAIISHSISNIKQLKHSLDNRLSETDINQLINNLIEINKNIQRAKHSNFQASEEHVRWLQKVKEAVIDFNDLIEDINLKNTVYANISRYRWVLSIVSHVRLTRQVTKEVGIFKTLIDDSKKLSFPDDASASSSRNSAYHEFENINMFGRENEKKEIIDELLKLNSSADFPLGVIVIVGCSGIGKTKLARLVCKDKRVKYGFSPIWIKTVAELTTTAFNDGGIRRLFVLDDLQIEVKDDLERLQQKLMEVGRTGWVILITTRSNHVADNISGFASRFVLQLQGLSEDISQFLFQHICRSTFASILANNKYNKEWREIVKDCGGVPFTIVVKAALMRKIVDEGRPIADVEIELLNDLKFIYYEVLPTHHKLCFSFCSLFPEDYLIDAERLIQLWTAEGFLTIPSNNNPEQQFGQACFNDFVPLVFHPVEEKEEKGVYRMNQLMHKLSKEVAGDENITVDLMGERVKEIMLRASFDFGLDLSCGIPDSMFDKAKKLRTILLPYKNTNNPRLPQEVKMMTSTCDKIFNTFKYSMRVLDLHDLGIKIVPNSIEEMKYLRFLDLSHNNIEKLPNCIIKLIHLQTLKLSYCHVLKELPKDLPDLSRLSHLDIEGCLDLTHMPIGIKKLTSLQTLSLFVASKKQVSGGLTELTDLKNLRGNLEILHLEQVKFTPSKEPANDEILKNKQHLRLLTLRWDHDEDYEEKSDINVETNNKKDDNDRELLECLQPHANLRVLSIVGYNGHTMSSWLTSLQSLVKFTLNDCFNCKSLPQMDQLPLLKVLHLRRLNSLEFISKNSSTSELEVASSSSATPVLFPSLKELTISDCPNLERWWENDEIWKNKRPYFPCISKLYIRCCPKLEHMPLCTNLDEELVLIDSKVKSMRETKTELFPLSKLKSMIIERIEESPPHNWLKGFTSLKELHIRDCSNLKSLPQGFNSLCSLKSLSIERCHELDLENPESEWKGLKNLHSLTLRSIPKLKATRGIGYVKSLKDLTFYDCHGLTSLLDNIGNLTSLDKLVISECRSLSSLPKGMKNLKSLNTLNITDCPLLLPRCQPDTGDDWPLIAHVKNILVRDTPQDLRDL